MSHYCLQPSACGVSGFWCANAVEQQDRERAGRAVQDDGLPTVDELAQFIRFVDGSHSLGAGALAEEIHKWLSFGAPVGAAPPVASSLHESHDDTP